MLLNEFSETYYKQMSEEQKALLHRFQEVRGNSSWPLRFTLLRSVVKTRRYTRTVYPPGWKFV